VAASNSKQLSNNNLMIIMVLVTLLVLGATGLVGKALVASIVRDTKVVSAKNKADKQLKDDLAAAPNLVNNYQRLGASANILADALPNNSDFPGLIVLLENMSNDSGVSLKSVAPSTSSGATGTAAAASTPTAPTSSSVGSVASSSLSSASGGSSSGTTSTTTGSATQASPQTYNFSLAFDGTYVGLLKLLGDLQTSARPMRIVGMQLAGSGAQLSGSLSLQTFYQDKAQLPFSTETIK
jgi:hypothetical protein